MQTFHLIGIKGAGMSALAHILKDMGNQVQGSDVEAFFFTQEGLDRKGIALLPFGANHIQEGQIVIASNAFPADHEEIMECEQKKMDFYRYHQFIGEFIQPYVSIAVTGAHGKTTTTGWMAHVFAAIKPASYLIGDGTGKGVQNGKYFIFESCEYRRHFLAYRPDYAVITNIDYDHPDYFSGIEDVAEAFYSMAAQVQKQLVVCGDDPNVRALFFPRPVMYYGLQPHNDLVASKVKQTGNGIAFHVAYKKKDLGRFSIAFHGSHNVLNALAVIGMSLLEDLNLELVRKHLLTYPGVKRRFAEKRVKHNVVIDDYAHHPTEIRATLEAVRAKYGRREIVAIFQPHTYTRLSCFMDEFAAALSLSDHTYVCDVFGSARESQGVVSAEQLRARIPQARLLHEHSIDQLLRHPKAVLLFMGAGDIEKFQRMFETIVEQQSIADLTANQPRSGSQMLRKRYFKVLAEPKNS